MCQVHRLLRPLPLHTDVVPRPLPGLPPLLLRLLGPRPRGLAHLGRVRRGGGRGRRHLGAAPGGGLVGVRGRAGAEVRDGLPLPGAKRETRRFHTNYS